MSGASPEPRRLIPVWFLPLLIGLVTITAGLFTWRAGQLASSAAYEDRQSVGQTLLQQRQGLEARVGAINDAVAYVRYLADFAEATSLDELVAELRARGVAAVADELSERADQLRVASSRVAAASGVFSQQAILTQLASSPEEPLPFDVDDQVRRLEAVQTTGVASGGVPDPDRWADQAVDTRERVRNLRFAALLLVAAIVGLTIAQLTHRVLIRRVGAAVGLALYGVVVVTTFASVY